MSTNNQFSELVDAVVPLRLLVLTIVTEFVWVGTAETLVAIGKDVVTVSLTDPDMVSVFSAKYTVELPCVVTLTSVANVIEEDSVGRVRETPFCVWLGGDWLSVE